MFGLAVSLGKEWRPPVKIPQNLLLHLKRDEEWGCRGRETPQAVCVELHSLAHGALLLSIFLTERLHSDWLYSRPQESSGVFNVMTHSRHMVPQGAVCVLLLESPTRAGVGSYSSQFQSLYMALGLQAGLVPF